MLLLITAAGGINAQIIDIPDENFKNKLLSSSIDNPAALDNFGTGIIVDTNDNGEIEMEEALLVYTFHLSSSNISSLEGIEHFTNLNQIVAGYNNLTSVDLTGLDNLKMVNIAFNPMTSINVTNLSGLERLYLYSNELTSLDLTGLDSLEDLSCGENDFINLTISNLPSLQKLSIEYTYYGSGSSLQELMLFNLPSLTELFLDNCNLSSLDFSGVPNLELLSALHNPFTSIDVSGLTQLLNMGISYTELTELDLSNNQSLKTISVQHSNQLESINLKNGGLCNFYLLPYNENLAYICIDEGEDVNIEEDMTPFPLVNVQYNTYCTFTPVGLHNTITGSFTYDEDGNGCDEDASISTFFEVSLSGDQNGYYYTNTGGYAFYLPEGNYTVTPNIGNDWFIISPESVTVNLEGVDNTVTQDFCIAPDGVHPDAEVIIVPVTTAQPGFDAVYKIIYKNKGNQTLSGDVTFTYDDTVLDYVEASLLETSSEEGLLVWSYDNLMPFEEREIWVTLSVNSPMETPAVNIGDEILYSASISPLNNDETIIDNTFGLKQIVVGSLDPNDITCLDGEIVNPDRIGEYLYYNINFENTGTAPATFIVVEDEINEEQFDISTLKLLNASHDVETRVTGNKVEFYFNDINLAADGGKGNVVFKIKTLNTLQENDNVMQQANIFFDYNFPIETNEANTTFATLSNTVFTKDNSVTLYPNPSKDIVNITVNTAITSVQLYDVQGRLLQTKEVKGFNTQLDISAQPSGLYFAKIKTENGTKVEKIVKE